MAASAAAGVGLVIPPRIEPSTATISTSGGKTTPCQMEHFLEVKPQKMSG